MTKVSLKLALDADNPGQMAALSIFAASLSRSAAGKGTVPQTITENTATYEACPEDEEDPTSEAAGTPPVDETAEAVSTQEEKPVAPAETKKTRKRRTRAEIEADDLGKEKGAPPRNEGESAEDYLNRISDEVSPKEETSTEPEETTEDEGSAAPAEETPTEPDPEVESAKATLRAELSKKVKQHKDAVIKEFSKYGATNVSSLPAEHYEEFTAFLKALK